MAKMMFDSAGVDASVMTASVARLSIDNSSLEAQNTVMYRVKMWHVTGLCT